ncbi:MAG TPA: DUF4251 domain-containing protein [Sphingobacteriaceae bacterium]
MHSEKFTLVIALCTWIFTACSSSQPVDDTRAGVQVKDLLKSKNYQFKAHYATPQGGRQILLTTDYFLRVSGTRVEAVLPYFGEAYSAPIGPGEAGVNFTSSNFSYDIEENKNRWTIIIGPRDTRDVQKLTLTVTGSGRASLHVNSNYKQAITYSGSIMKAPKAGNKHITH